MPAPVPPSPAGLQATLEYAVAALQHALDLLAAETAARAAADAALQALVTGVQSSAGSDAASLQTQINDRTSFDYVNDEVADLQAQINNRASFDYVNGQVSSLQGQINGKANLNSPAFSGTPTVPSPADGNRSTRIATTQFVGNSETFLQNQINALSQRVSNAGW